MSTYITYYKTYIIISIYLLTPFQSQISTLTTFKSWASKLTGGLTGGGMKKHWLTSPDEVNMSVTHGYFKPIRSDDSSDSLSVTQPPMVEDSLSLSSEDIELFTTTTNPINIPLPLREQPPLRLPEFGQDAILVKPKSISSDKSSDNNSLSNNDNWILLPSPGAYLLGFYTVILV